MRLVDDSGSMLTSRFSVKPFEGQLSVVLEAAWGSEAWDYPHVKRRPDRKGIPARLEPTLGGAVGS